MMLEIKLADICMFEEIYEVLKGFKNPRINMDDWKNLLTYHWRTPDENPGFVLLDDGRVVGYIGTIFSKRHVNGKIEKNCNLTSWIVKDKYRKESLKLLLHILKLKNIVCNPHEKI